MWDLMNEFVTWLYWWCPPGRVNQSRYLGRDGGFELTFLTYLYANSALTQLVLVINSSSISLSGFFRDLIVFPFEFGINHVQWVAISGSLKIPTCKFLQDFSRYLNLNSLSVEYQFHSFVVLWLSNHNSLWCPLYSLCIIQTSKHRAFHMILRIELLACKICIDSAPFRWLTSQDHPHL